MGPSLQLQHVLDRGRNMSLSPTAHHEEDVEAGEGGSKCARSWVEGGRLDGMRGGG